MSKTIGILASGRGSNAKAILDAINKGLVNGEVKLIITDNPSAKVLELGQLYNVKAICIDRKNYMDRGSFEAAMLEALNNEDVELVVLAGYMRILSSSFVEEYHGRIMNIHPSLLPSFKGLDAQKQALDYGVRVAGCTVHFVDAGMDTGPIILQKAVPVYEDDDEPTLAARILIEEHFIYPEAVKLFCEDKLILKDNKVLIKLKK